MGVSIDQAKLEDLRKLSAFFEFISNPQAYKDFLAETKAVLAGMEKTIAAHTTVEKAAEYLAAAQTKLAEVNQAVEEFNAKQVATAAEAALKNAADWEEVAIAQSHAEELKLELARQDATLRLGQDELVAAQERLSKREQAVGTKELQLAERERELEAKKARLTAILG